MNLFNDERKLFELEKGRLILTSHRIRYESQLNSQHVVKSIMLEELSFCRMEATNQPAWLILAVLCAAVSLLTFLSQNKNDQQIGVGLLIVAAILFAIWLGSRKRILEFGSSAGVIRLRLRKTSKEEAIQVIDVMDQAKNYRYYYPLPRREVVRQAS